MSIVSAILRVVRRKHPAVEQFITDASFFRDLGAKITTGQDVARKQAVLTEAVAALKDQKYNSIAKMALASVVDESSDWPALIAAHPRIMEQALAGSQLAIDHSAGILQRAQHELPILTRNIFGLAGKGVVSAKGKEVWAAYVRESGSVEEARALWRCANAEKNPDNRQQIHASIWTRAMNENLSEVVRLEMLEPRNSLVAKWKILVQRFAKGEDVSQDLALLNQSVRNALTAKLAEFAKKTFGVAISTAK